MDGKLFFPTAEEAAYPIVLCQRFASICLDEAKCRGLSRCQSLQQQLMVDQSVGKRNLFAAQSRGNKLKQILAEYGREVVVPIPIGHQQADKLLQEFPKGTNVIHRQLHWGFTRDDWRRKSSTLVSVWKFVPLWGATWHWCDLTFIEPSVVKLDYGKMSASDLSSLEIAL